MVEVILVTVVRQDRGPQVAVTADVDIGLAVLAGLLDERGPKHRLEAIEVVRAVKKFCAPLEAQNSRDAGQGANAPDFEIDPGGVPLALGVKEAVEQPRLPPGVAAGIRRLEHLAGPLHTDGEGRRNSQHMGAEAVTVDKNPGWILVVMSHSFGNFDLQLFLAEAGPPGAVDRYYGLPMKGISKHHGKAVTLIIIIMDKTLGLGPEDHAVVGGEAEGHSSRWPRQILGIGQGFRNKNVARGMQSCTLQSWIPGGSPGLLEKTKISPFVPVLNLAVLPFLELSRELSLVRQKRLGSRLLLPRFPGNLLEG